MRIKEIKEKILKDKGMPKSAVKFHTRELTGTGFFIFSCANWDNTKRLFFVAKYEEDHPTQHRVWLYHRCETLAEAKTRFKTAR